MKRFHADGGIPTLAVALDEYMNAGELKQLASLTGSKLPTRKADLADVIVRHLEGERLRTVWQCLDEIQKAALAEVVQRLAGHAQPNLPEHHGPRVDCRVPR